MKKVALTVAVLALGLAACEKKTEETTVVDNNAVENVESDMNAATDMNATENALDNAAAATSNAAEATSNAAEATANAAANATSNAM